MNIDLRIKNKNKHYDYLLRISRNKAEKCSNYLNHILEEYLETEQSPEDDVYFGLSYIAKQLEKAVKRSDRGIE